VRRFWPTLFQGVNVFEWVIWTPNGHVFKCSWSMGTPTCYSQTCSQIVEWDSLGCPCLICRETYFVPQNNYKAGHQPHQITMMSWCPGNIKTNINEKEMEWIGWLLSAKKNRFWTYPPLELSCDTDFYLNVHSHKLIQTHTHTHTHAFPPVWTYAHSTQAHQNRCKHTLAG
jgi:hypothetical protein